MRGRHRFHPHGLPDAGGAGIEQPAGLGALLADRERVGLVAVLHPDGDLLVAGAAQRRGDVGAESGEAALVAGHLPAVHPDGGDLIDGPEVQQQTAAVPVGRNLKCSAVPHLVVMASDPRQCRFRWVRDENPLAVRVGSRRRGQQRHSAAAQVTPHAVEGEPAGSRHLRARVVRQRVGRSHQRGPRRRQRWRFRVPHHHRTRRRRGSRRHQQRDCHCSTTHYPDTHVDRLQRRPLLGATESAWGPGVIANCRRHSSPSDHRTARGRSTCLPSR